MKRIFLLVFIAVLQLALVSCSAATKTKTTTRTETVRVQGNQTAIAQYKAAADVCFREGTAANGKVVLSSGDIAFFSTDCEKSRGFYEIVFQLTEAGKKSFSEETKKMLGGVISVWVGTERLQSPRIEAPITDGRVALPVGDESSLNRICGQLKTSDGRG